MVATVNTGLTLLYWKVGSRIRQDVLADKRADYGKEIVVTVAQQLSTAYGIGWSAKQLRHCLRATETFSEEQIVFASQRQLSWTHLKALMYIDDALKRAFYIEMCSLENWSTRTLQDRMNSMLSLIHILTQPRCRK